MKPQAEFPITPPDRRIYLAYDGSINADWVSRYAIRLASSLEDRRINLLHIPDGTYPTDTIGLKIKAIENECSFHGIRLEVRVIPLSGNVFRTLVRSIPEGPASFCVCGARITSRGRGFLRGTISEKLLRAKKFNVLALRVVQPGLLGFADELLVPLAGHPRGFRAAQPFFSLLVPVIRSLYLLRIMEMGPLSLRYISREKARELYQEGLAYVRRVAEEIRKETGDGRISFRLDTRVVLSDDWVKEVLVHAGRLKTRLILLGASERPYPSALLQGGRLERLLRKTPCDVAVYRSV
ncbi:MAG: hypothetical protein Kow0089_06530 [Desulfobulbaceae bacterium]